MTSDAPTDTGVRAMLAAVALRLVVYAGWAAIAGAYVLMTHAWYQSHGNESEFMWGCIVLVPAVGLCSLAYGTYVQSCRHRLRRSETVVSWVFVTLGAGPFLISVAAGLAESVGFLRAVAVALGLACVAVGMAAMPGFTSGHGGRPMAGVNAGRLRLCAALAAATVVVWIVASLL